MAIDKSESTDLGNIEYTEDNSTVTNENNTVEMKHEPVKPIKFKDIPIIFSLDNEKYMVKCDLDDADLSPIGIKKLHKLYLLLASVGAPNINIDFNYYLTVNDLHSLLVKID